MPLFEIKGTSELMGFRALKGGSELYESEIEDLMWANPDELTGESLFPVARQPVLPEGGKPDIVCLDGQGRVVVVEIKRDIARSQLAQCLEYAGWARTTNLQELASIYHDGHDAFFAAWQEFTEADAPTPIRPSPRLILVAREFHGRTGSALEFLVEHGLPVLLTRIALYEDANGRRFLDVEGDHEPDVSSDGGPANDATRIEGRRLRVSDLLDEGILQPGESVVWKRPRVGEEHQATITEEGHLRLQDGRTFSSPSRAAKEAAGIPSYDGWYAWRTVTTGDTLHALREDSAPPDRPIAEEMAIHRNSPGAPAKSGPIAVYGATGFTGGLIVRELKRVGADFSIAGRDREKLEALSEELGGVPVVAVSLDDSAGLREMLEPCSVVVACAGPFTLHGEPLVAAAADTGTHYLDTTGEQGFMRMVFDRHGDRAAKQGAALVSGMGFDYAPGDLIAALTADGMGPLEELVVAYCVHGFAPTHGTALSGLEIMRGGDVVWSGGEWQQAPRRADGGRWRFPEPIGEQRMLRYPAGEQVTVPRHVETARVRTLLNGMVVPPRLMPLAAAASPLLGLAMRTPLRQATAALIRRLPAAPSERAREAARFTISCEVRSKAGARRGTVRGSDVYGLTAASLAHGALLCADPAYDRSGALAPAQAFDPSSFLAALADFGVSVEVEPLPAAADR